MSASSDEWYTMPVLSGHLIRLEPLAVEHAEGYLAAGTPEGAEIFRWVTTAGTAATGALTGIADARADIAAASAARARGQRFAYAQIDAGTGEFAGSSSYYEVDPTLRSIAIGHTWLGRRWWRTGHNTESKLLMLRHAFDTLGAARVVWHTDIHNDRSQVAIGRLGATREGEFRKHRIRRDGSWRTTVQFSMTDDDWPAAHDRLVARLARG